MSYTGNVSVGGPADTRELPGLAITKVAVGPMDNNAYLLRCTQTGRDHPHRQARGRRAGADGNAVAAVNAAEAGTMTAGQLAVLPPPGPLPDKLYVAIDGTGIPMTAAETEGRAGKGEDGKARTREVKMAAVFTQTAVDEQGYPVRDPGSSSYLATLAAAPEFGILMAAEARRRGAGHVAVLIAAGQDLKFHGALARERDKALHYFEVNSHRMRYAWYRSLGLFVGSGVVEAGCKPVIGQRLKLSGMRWTQAGATGILTLRCQEASNRWEQIWQRPQTPAA